MMRTSYLVLLTCWGYVIVSGCGGSWSTLSGTITSPGYPSLYGSGDDCVYNIVPLNTVRKIVRRIQMKLDYIDISYVDTLQVLDDNNQVVASLVGYENYSTAAESTFYKVTLFRNSPYIHNGFSASWIECGSTWEDEDSGTVTSPGHPGNYHNKAHCIYKVIPNSDNLVRLVVTNFNTDVKDVLEVRSGPLSLAVLAGNVGRVEFENVAAFEGEFKSDASVVNTGFQMSWDLQPPPTTNWAAVMYGLECANIHKQISLVNTAGSTDAYPIIRQVPTATECMYRCVAEATCKYYAFNNTVCTIMKNGYPGTFLHPEMYKVIV